MSFYQDVYSLLGQVPASRLVTYAQLARALGMPHGARAVGWAMRHCPEGLPWHRVINAGGRISAAPASERYIIQAARLAEEGVDPDLNGRYDLALYGWKGF
ncbi:MAG: MGMT family protein [Anaerolineae bacterium]